MRCDVICIGSATVDHFLEITESFQKIKAGAKLLIDEKEIHTGGGATNSAAELSRWGLKVRMLAKVGADKEGELILREMQKEYGVKNITRHHSRKKTDSSLIISSPKERDRIIMVHKGASDDLQLSDFKKRELRCSWIYLGSVMGSSFKTVLEIIKENRKSKILFNPSAYLAEKGLDYLKPILFRTEILILNQEEARALLKTKHSEAKSLLQRLQDLGPKIVIITNGAKRLYALNGKRFYSSLPPSVKVVNTAGAGDAFNSGLLAAIIKKCSFSEALRLAQAVSAKKIQSFGAKSNLLNEKEARAEADRLKIKINEHGI